MKSQLFIPLDGTLLKRIGISTLSPGFAATVAISITNAPGGTVGLGDVVGFGDDVGCVEEPKLTPPSTNLTAILFKS
jgi:hypothetical protein